MKDSFRYRTLFTLVLLLFSVLLLYRLVGEKNFRYFLEEVRQSFISPVVEDIKISIESRDEIKSYQSFNQKGKIGVGAYFPDLSEDRFHLIIEHENMLNHKLQYLLLFRAWGDEDSDFPTEYIENIKRLHLVPIITWEPWSRDFENATVIQPNYSLESIASGSHDSYIRQWAKESKDADILMILRFGHEQSTHPGERSWYPWQGKPATYVAAYRRIVNIFREVGANNVRFMWNPVSFWPDSTMTYYPGDNYVDYLGLTVLNHGVNSGQEDNRWKLCKEILTDQYQVVSSIDKPVILVEFASSERGGSKPLWWEDCFDRMKRIDNLVGFVTLESESDVAYPDVSWGVKTSAESIDSFKREISFSIFK